MIKLPTPNRLWRRETLFAFLLPVLAATGCQREHRASLSAGSNLVVTAAAPGPLAFMLAPHGGEGRLDAGIRQLQEKVLSATNQALPVEQLGWAFVAKARESFDPGYYKLAEQCALHLSSRYAESPESLLLLGHALHSQHRFHQAETIAHQLVERRGISFDFGLLGDILVDLGRVREAADAYQQMLDLKPDPRGYARAAHLRWLKGDLSGAVEVMQMAARGASPRDAESMAWMHTQLARYLWQAAALGEAERALAIALETQTNYPPALLIQGRLLMGQGKTIEAVASLRLAASANPLPEYQWALGGALHSAGRLGEAQQTEAQLVGRGAGSDPRTLSLYLATRGEQLALATDLARRELEERGDVFSHDALAWALAASGDLEAARTEMALALVEGTADARLFLHAAVIAARTGHLSEAKDWMKKLDPITALLFPGEMEHLRTAERLASAPTPARPVPGATAASAPFPTTARDAAVTEN